MAYKRTYYRANFASGMDPGDKDDFLEGVFTSGCQDDLGGVIVGRPSDGPVFVLEGENSAVDQAVAALDNARELTDNAAVYSESLSSHDEGLALYLEDDVTNTCNYNGSS